MTTRLYVKPKTKAHDAARAHLRLYGLAAELQRDGDGTYFDVTPPIYWTKYRRDRFKAGLNMLEWL